VATPLGDLEAKLRVRRRDHRSARDRLRRIKRIVHRVQAIRRDRDARQEADRAGLRVIGVGAGKAVQRRGQRIVELEECLRRPHARGIDVRRLAREAPDQVQRLGLEPAHEVIRVDAADPPFEVARRRLQVVGHRQRGRRADGAGGAGLAQPLEQHVAA